MESFINPAALHLGNRSAIGRFHVRFKEEDQGEEQQNTLLNCNEITRTTLTVLFIIEL